MYAYRSIRSITVIVLNRNIFFLSRQTLTLTMTLLLLVRHGIVNMKFVMFFFLRVASLLYISFTSFSVATSLRPADVLRGECVSVLKADTSCFLSSFFFSSECLRLCLTSDIKSVQALPRLLTHSLISFFLSILSHTYPGYTDECFLDFQIHWPEQEEVEIYSFEKRELLSGR